MNLSMQPLNYFLQNVTHDQVLSQVKLVFLSGSLIKAKKKLSLPNYLSIAVSKGIRVKWNANSLIQNLTLGLRF